MDAVDVTEIPMHKSQPNASQMGLTTWVLNGLYQKTTWKPVFLAISLLLLLGTVSAQGYSLIVFGVVMFVTLRESLGVIEYAHLQNDNIMDDLKNLAAKINIYNAVVFGLLILSATYLPSLLTDEIATSIILGAICAVCAPLFGIAGLNYLLGSSKVDTNKIATLNKYASLNAGIICSLSFFLIKNPANIKLLAMMCLVSFFSFFLFKKTNTPDMTTEDWRQTRSGASNYVEPTLNFGYFLILFVAAVLLLYSSSQEAGGISLLIESITEINK